MKAIFIELSSFSARRSDYLTDDEFRKFQNVLMKSPKELKKLLEEALGNG
jgi:hypothetical protein